MKAPSPPQDGYGNSRVHRLRADGTHMASWGASGTGSGEFNCPHGIAMHPEPVGPNGEAGVIVCDRENSRVQVRLPRPARPRPAAANPAGRGLGPPSQGGGGRRRFSRWTGCRSRAGTATARCISLAIRAPYKIYTAAWQ
jgi:hypothetical protein